MYSREVTITHDGVLYAVDYWECGTLRATEEYREYPGDSIKSWLHTGFMELPKRDQWRPATPGPVAFGAVLLLCFLAACTGPRPLRPGTASMNSAAATAGAQFTSTLQQPENPAQSAAQNFERTTETELPLPAGTILETENGERRTQNGRGNVEHPTSNAERRTQEPYGIVLREPTVQKTRTVEKATTTIGAAQKDTAREVGAKLASLRGVVWVGLLVFLFGLASLVWPPLRAIVGSVTTSLAAMAGGVALMVLPSLIAGHELLIMGSVAASVGGWFLAHRHGKASATASTMEKLGKAVAKKEGV